MAKQLYNSKGLDFTEQPTDTASFLQSVLVMRPVDLSWVVRSTISVEEESYAPVDEKSIAAGLNSILGEFDNPDAHKSFNTIEELFADLDKE